MLDATVKFVRVDELSALEGFSGRMSHPDVIELAASIKENGSEELPVVRASDLAIAYGEDIIAANILNGNWRVKVRLVELSDNDVATMRQLEAAKRRRDKATEFEAENKLLESMELKVDAARREGVLPKQQQRGRPKTARGVAREIVAELTGTTVEALSKKSSRAFRRGAERVKPKEVAVECYGFDDLVPKDMLQKALEANSKAHLIADYFKRAKTEASKLTTLAIPEPYQMRVYELASRGLKETLAACPSHLCPYCKCVKDVRLKCSACLTTGFVSKEVFTLCPDEVRLEERVVYGGQIVNMHTLKPVLAFEEKFTEPEEFEDSFEDEQEPPREWQPEKIGPEDFGGEDFPNEFEEREV